MSAKFGFLDDHQPGDARPTVFIPKQIALLMIRRGIADRLGHRLIRRRAKYTPALPSLCRQTFKYIPEKMPSREVPGCFFQMPQNDLWKIQHRTVTFMPREA